jgi:curli biogenesis system outer membrane secretion channel CsgG
MTRKHVQAFVVAGLVAMSVGCITSVRPELAVRQTVPVFDASFIRSIAVLEFENETNVPGAGRAMAEHFEEILANESGFEVMARIDLDRVAKERKLALSGRAAREDLLRLGEAVGVTAVVLGTIDECSVIEATLSGQEVRRTARLSMRVKLVDTVTGRIVWSRRVTDGYAWSGWVEDVRGMSCAGVLRAAMTRTSFVAREWFGGGRLTRRTMR